jgi:hypothetical protein
MYMALFNFWAAAEYYQKGNVGNGRSGEGDDFRERDFDRTMISLVKSKEIMYLSFSRNASDHRIMNPASNLIFVTSPKTKASKIKIDNNRLRKSYLCFQELIRTIKLR